MRNIDSHPDSTRRGRRSPLRVPDGPWCQPTWQVVEPAGDRRRQAADPCAVDACNSERYWLGGPHSAGAERRGASEPIAIFVPTWSVETWLAHLCGTSEVDEATPMKDDGKARALWGDGTREAATIKTAVAAWSGSSTQLPSLQAAYDEAPKVGLSSR